MSICGALQLHALVSVEMKKKHAFELTFKSKACLQNLLTVLAGASLFLCRGRKMAGPPGFYRGRPESRGELEEGR